MGWYKGVSSANYLIENQSPRTRNVTSCGFSIADWVSVPYHSSKILGDKIEILKLGKYKILIEFTIPNLPIQSYLIKYDWIGRVGIVNSIKRLMKPTGGFESWMLKSSWMVNSIKRHDLAHWGVRILDAQVSLDGTSLEVRVPVHTCTWDSTIIEGAATRYSVKA